MKSTLEIFVLKMTDACNMVKLGRVVRKQTTRFRLVSNFSAVEDSEL